MEHQVFDVLLGLAEDVSTPRALSVAILMRAGEWAELQKLRCDPSHYLEEESYWRDNLITEILRKCDLPTSVDREQAAIETFLACEKANCRTNVRLHRFLPKHLLIEEGEGPVYDFICRWRKEVQLCMGNLPDHLVPRFGQGATFADTGKLTTAPDKMSSRPTVYHATKCLVPMWGETLWCRSLVETAPWRSEPRMVRGNIFFTVPKDGTKFRGCCKEASIPVGYQLDIGRFMKVNCLPRIGIDLFEGQELHESLAKEASISGEYATIDMSNASDTLARVLPELLLREDWFMLLDSLRASHTRVNGRWYRLEKFSSMGNGFTFELETVIFATLARTLVRQMGGDPDSVKCYGDDLIVPALTAPSVIKALEWFGFQPNPKKTFLEGPFRESCGGDFWNGVPVRGHYLEELPDEPQQWISLANGLRRVARANGAPPSRWSLVSRTWRSVVARIPSDIRRCIGPSWLGDVVLNDDNPASWNTKPLSHYREKIPDPADPRGLAVKEITLATSGWDQLCVLAYVPIPEVLPWHHWKPATQLAAAVLGFGSEGITPRGGTKGYKRKWIPVLGVADVKGS